MKNIFRGLHLWLSIPFGTVIVLICFSGAMLVFEDEISQASNPHLYFVDKASPQPLPLNVLTEKVSATLPDSVHVVGITIFADPMRTYQVNLSKPKRAAIFIDPYSGEVKGCYERAPFFATMFKLHRWLLGSARAVDGSMGVGKIVVGISTLFFVIILISGTFIWWPRTKKMLKNRLSINIQKGKWRFFYDLHVAGGVYALVFLLAMALTGLTWSFQWYRNGFYAVFGVEPTQSNAHNVPANKTNKTETAKDFRLTTSHWQHVFETIVVNNPQFQKISLSNNSASVYFERFGNQRAADKYTFDAKTGAIMDTLLYEATPNSNKIRGWIYSVHVGNWGGWITRIFTFLAALLGATLPLTGYYLWWKRRWGRTR